MKPHKHAELIKAWADGAEIEMFTPSGNWIVVEYPNWSSELMSYRIKPEPKPDFFEDWQPTVKFEDGVYKFDLPNGDEFVIVPKQDVVMYGKATIYFDDPKFSLGQVKGDNLKLTFDSQTFELKLAEVLK